MLTSGRSSDAACGVVPIDVDRSTDNCILALTDDLLIRILHDLNPKEIVYFGAACRRFQVPASDERFLWATICRNIVGDAAVSDDPESWGVPSFKRLYCDLLRSYGHLLGRPWHSSMRPLGSLLVAFASPPFIVGAIVACMRFGEPGISAVPVFRVGYDDQRGCAVVSCVRAANSFQALLRRTAPPGVQPEAAAAAPGGPEEDAPPPHGAELALHFTRPAGKQVVPAQSPMAAPPSPVSGDSSLPGSEDDGRGPAESPGGSGEPQLPLWLDPQEQHVGLRGEEEEDVHLQQQQQQQPHSSECSLGCGGADLAGFTFRCSAGCRHAEVEAVCRWGPEGLAPLPEFMLEPPPPAAADKAASPPTAASTSATAAAAAGARPSSSAPVRAPAGVGRRLEALPYGADDVVDLDVLATYRPHERVHRVAMTFQTLLSYDLDVPVPYRRLSAGGYPPGPPTAPPAATPGRDGGPSGSDGPHATSRTPGVNDILRDAGAAEGVGGASGPADAGDGTSGSCSEGVSSSGGSDGATGRKQKAEGWELQGGGEPEPLHCNPLISPHPLEGIWRGTYAAHGIEMVQLVRIAPRILEARKLLGDDNVPAGVGSFRVYLDCPGEYTEQIGKRFVLPSDYASRVDLLSGLGDTEGSSGPPPPAVLDALAAKGRIAGSGFRNPQWIDGEVVLLGRNTFGMLWREIRSFSVFRRMRLRTEW